MDDLVDLGGIDRDLGDVCPSGRMYRGRLVFTLMSERYVVGVAPYCGGALLGWCPICLAPLSSREEELQYLT